ncbi:MAG: hypothetical protein WC654_01935 [Patescibacteria group bacterium]
MATDGREKDGKLVKPVETPAVVGVAREQVSVPEIQRATETGEKLTGDVSISETKIFKVAEPPSSVVSTPVRPAPPKIDRLAKEIESILSEDLTDIYLAMSPDTQQEFKVKGEETASKVRELVRAVKINAKKVFQLIRDWMKMIPGVNHFFLEQEAKIKTDKILLVSEEERKQNDVV